MWIKVTDAKQGLETRVNMDQFAGMFKEGEFTALVAVGESFMVVKESPAELLALMGLEQATKASEGLAVPEHVWAAIEGLANDLNATPTRRNAVVLSTWIRSLAWDQSQPQAEFARGYAKGKADQLAATEAAKAECGQPGQERIDAAYRRGHRDGQTFYAQGKAVTTALQAEYTRGYSDATKGRMPMPNAKG